MKKNKAVILFLVKFFAVYFSLIGLYNLYLNNTQERETFFSCAPITKTVTNQSAAITRFLGYDVFTAQNTDELTMRFLVNDVYVARIVEGCSSISIIILFIAFIVAFSGSLKHTLIFGLLGVFLIYITNLIRIVILVLIIYHYPEYERITHDIVFPAIIYGMTFLLWIIWVKKYAKINKN